MADRSGSTLRSLAPRTPWRRRLTLAVAAMAALLVVLATPGIAAADPDDPDGEPPQTTLELLEALSRAYYDSQVALAASQQRQAEIRASLEVAQANLDAIVDDIGRLAAARYKGAEFGLVTGIINADISRQQLLAGASVGEYLLWRDDTYIHRYRELRDEADRQNQLLEDEIAIQQHTQEMLDQQTIEAERALAAEGGVLQTGGWAGGPAQLALNRSATMPSSHPRQRPGDKRWGSSPP